MNTQHLAGILISLFFSALFSGIEIAFVASNKLHIELQNKQGVFSGKVLSAFVKNPSRFIGTILIGNIIALVVYGIFMASVIDPWLAGILPVVINNDFTIIILEIIISALIILITAGFLPRTIVLINPDAFLAFFAIPMRIIYWVMYPIVFLVVAASKVIITKVLRLEYSETKSIFGLTDPGHYANGHTLGSDGPSEETEVDTRIFNNALEFKTIRVKECMVPRTELAAVEINDTMQDLKNAFVKSGHSKILIYRETIDDIIGYCHALALFKKPKDIATILSPVIIVAETMLVNELLVRFTTERKSLALVVDEFGGTSGIITLEDVMEQIFGEIQDEYDESEDWVEQKLDDYNYLLSARHEIDYLNEKYGWQLPEGDYETLGGFIISVNQDIPEVGDIIEAPPFTFTIISKEEARLDTVKLSLTENTDNVEK